MTWPENDGERSDKVLVLCCEAAAWGPAGTTATPRALSMRSPGGPAAEHCHSRLRSRRGGRCAAHLVEHARHVLDLDVERVCACKVPQRHTAGRQGDKALMAAARSGSQRRARCGAGRCRGEPAGPGAHGSCSDTSSVSSSWPTAPGGDERAGRGCLPPSRAGTHGSRPRALRLPPPSRSPPARCPRPTRLARTRDMHTPHAQSAQGRVLAHGAQTSVQPPCVCGHSTSSCGPHPRYPRPRRTRQQRGGCPAY